MRLDRITWKHSAHSTDVFQAKGILEARGAKIEITGPPIGWTVIWPDNK